MPNQDFFYQSVGTTRNSVGNAVILVIIITFIYTLDPILFRSERQDASAQTSFEKFGLSKPRTKIAAFNIQVFGDKKYEKKDVVEILIKVTDNFLLKIFTIGMSGNSTPGILFNVVW